MQSTFFMLIFGAIPLQSPARHVRKYLQRSNEENIIPDV